MKFTIEKNILLENLSNVVKAISTKNIIPISIINNPTKYFFITNHLNIIISPFHLFLIQ